MRWISKVIIGIGKGLVLKAISTWGRRKMRVTVTNLSGGQLKDRNIRVAFLSLYAEVIGLEIKIDLGGSEELVGGEYCFGNFELLRGF